MRTHSATSLNWSLWLCVASHDCVRRALGTTDEKAREILDITFRLNNRRKLPRNASGRSAIRRACANCKEHASALPLPTGTRLGSICNPCVGLSAVALWPRAVQQVRVIPIPTCCQYSVFVRHRMTRAKTSDKKTTFLPELQEQMHLAQNRIHMSPINPSRVCSGTSQTKH